MENRSIYRLWFVVFMTCWLRPAALAADVAPALHYDVTVPGDLTHFDVSICFHSPPPAYFYLPEDATADQFRNIVLVAADKQRKLTSQQQRLRLSGAKQGDCLRYSAWFNGAITHPWFKSRQSRHQQIRVTLDQWLITPTPDTTPAAQVEFHLPEGFAVSAPGKLQSVASGRRVYQFRPRSIEMEGDIAVGRMVTFTRTVGNAHIDIALLQGQQPFDQAKITSWLDANLLALRQLYGDFPVPDLQLLVVPVGNDREPVPWGESTRGGGDAVHVYIDETRPLQELLADWVLIHELSHLLHPAISDEGRWLSEGLASYYQNVLAARGGLITEQKAWDNLDAGFMRGSKGTPADQTLAQVAETMQQNHLFMRIYWSGAAISLLADTRLRKLSHNQQSLDSVLQQFAQCCLPADTTWTASTLLQKFDALSNTRIFSDLYTEYVDSTQFPRLQPTYLELGLIPARAHVGFAVTAPGLAVRQAIMRKYGQ